ncbi:Transcription initiation factor TFIID subunit 12 [Madurella fahalii]|uniref:Transcription initiation factor TFIID subunit 12 n=1 Tax=Madurella fahalii TaxID=1157608 RepID=A0ABQ0GID4_9PEZI
MNSASGQNTAGRPAALNAQAAGAPIRQQGPPLYRPEMMRNITFLGEEDRIKYEKGLAHLWKQHDSAAPGSPEQIEAKRKIGEFGKILVTKIQHIRQQQQQNQQAQQQQKQRPPQPVPSGQTAPQTQPTQAAQSGPSNLGNTSSQAPTTTSQASPNPNAPQQPARSLPPHIINHVNEMTFQPPPTVQDKAKWVEDIKQRYAKAIYTMESARNGIKAIDQTLENTSPSPEERKKIEERKIQLQKQYGDAIGFANLVRKQYGGGGGNQKTAQNGGTTPNAGNQGRPQGVAQPGQGAGNGPATIAAAAAAAANPMQSSAAAVNAAIEAAKKQQLAAGRIPGVNALPAQQGPSAHPHQSQAQAPATPAQAQPSPVTQAAPAQPAMPQQQPQQPQQSQQAQQPPPPIKIEPGAQPLPAPLNTAMAAGAAGMQSAGTPTQNSARIQTPQSATPTTANANIRPLTHAAAMNLASQQRAGAMPGGPTAGSGTTPASTLGVMGAGQQPGHPHAHPPQPTAQTNLQSKLPIPKVLHDKAAQMPQPVPNIGGIGSGRPTYSGGGGIGGGVMNQPALPKTPAYQLEGEGERVLNKKKLDELVRQVCGGAAEGQEGNLLTPEVEESVLNMADAFVDNVLHQACRNAKERGSKVLEIRDIQLVLERTYNIRIPGYSSEELRTVRKVQPNNSWIKKMSAVQAAKVVPGKGDL